MNCNTKGTYKKVIIEKQTKILDDAEKYIEQSNISEQEKLFLNHSLRISRSKIFNQFSWQWMNQT